MGGLYNLERRWGIGPTLVDQNLPHPYAKQNTHQQLMYTNSNNGPHEPPVEFPIWPATSLAGVQNLIANYYTWL